MNYTIRIEQLKYDSNTNDVIAGQINTRFVEVNSYERAMQIVQDSMIDDTIVSVWVAKN